jgi:hypothetical protein
MASVVVRALLQRSSNGHCARTDRERERERERERTGGGAGHQSATHNPTPLVSALRHSGPHFAHLNFSPPLVSTLRHSQQFSFGHFKFSPPLICHSSLRTQDLGQQFSFTPQFLSAPPCHASAVRTSVVFFHTSNSLPLIAVFSHSGAPHRSNFFCGEFSPF